MASKKVLTIVGARPQFVKAAPVNRAMLDAGLEEVLVHTGQHFDHEMSDIFFRELDIAEPRYNLGIGGGGHGQMTGAMLAKLEEVMVDEKPDWVMVYGDTNSTLAGALAAVKLHIPIAHVEAGLRSFNRRMPEEINRLLTDQVSGLLFCPTQPAADNLSNEGISKGVHVVGDVMADASELARNLVSVNQDKYLSDETCGLIDKPFILLTLHRAENVDDDFRLKAIVDALNEIDQSIVMPIHPRSRKALDLKDYSLGDHVHVIQPVGYLEMTALLMESSLVLTDSGGLQKEAYWARKPCITLRTETEWVETVEWGWNQVIGKEIARLPELVADIKTPAEHPQFGDEHAAATIAKTIAAHELN
tara:strand:- start:2215 stop:3297 length:1083 start_codon:yes stop_codon:yes gene_type:complete